MSSEPELYKQEKTRKSFLRVVIFSFLTFNFKFMNKVVNLAPILYVIGRTFYFKTPHKHWDYSKLSVGKILF